MNTYHQIPVQILAGIVAELGNLKTDELQEIASILEAFTCYQTLAARIAFLAQAKQVMETLERNY